MFTVMQIAAVTGGRISGSPDGEVSGVSTDSRSISAGELFVPLRGARFDGHGYIADVAARGVRVVLADTGFTGVLPDGVTLVVVDDTLRALGDLAADYRRRFTLPLIAITGSNGKTTTKEMLASILSQTGSGLKTEGNLNNLIGLPQTLFRLSEEARWAVLEMGMSEPGEIDRLAEIAGPQTGIVLNAYPAHLQSMGSIEGVARAKGELLLRLPAGGSAIVNADDRLISRQPVADGARRITFGLADADVTATDIISKGVEGQRFQLNLAGKQYLVDLSAYGQHAIYDALAAAAAAHAIGIEPEMIRSGLEQFRPYDKRFRLEALTGLILIDDSYNANPASMNAALETLQGLKGDRLAFVALGDMLELGDDEMELHRSLGEAAARVADRLYLTGSLTVATAEGAVSAGMDDENVFFGMSHEEIVADIIRNASPGDFVLVKGSRGMRMEKVAEGIRQRH